jgi:plastocyanin
MRAALLLCLIPTVALAVPVRGTLVVPPDARSPEPNGTWRVENGLLPVLPRAPEPRNEAVVIAEGGPPRGADGPPVVVELRGLRLDPRVVVVSAGGTVEFRNTDRAPHTLYCAGILQPQPTPAGQTRAQKFTTAGQYRIEDEEYPHVSGTVVVADTPWVAQLDDKGGFHFDLPEGHYTLRVFFRGAWTVTRPLDVGPHAVDVTVHATGAKP